jgi:hypothetical protein
MATVTETFDFPPRYINYYLHELLSSYDDINMAQSPGINGYIPFSPAGVYSDLDAFYQNLQSKAEFSGNLPAVLFYDRMIRLRNSPFYVGKREQTLYTIFARTEDAHKIGMVLSQVLDREDASGQDLNEWINNNRDWLSAPVGTQVGTKFGAGLPMKVFFRNMRVFQVDESRDLTELNTYRGGTMHKYIVEYDYHLKDNPEFL